MFNITNNRILFFILLAFMATISVITSDLYLPAMPVIADYYHASHDSIELTITIYMLGMTIGLLIYGNILDIFGRRPVLITGVSIYLIGTIICLYSHTLGLLLLGRLIQSLGGSAAVVTWQSVAHDVYEKEAQHYMPVLFGLLSVSPATAPIVGGYLTAWFGWQSNFTAMLMVGLILFLIVVFSLPETGKSHLKKNKNYLNTVIEANKFLLNDKRFLSLSVFPALNQGNFYAYVTASAFIFHNLGYTSKAIGLFYIPTALFYFVASIVSRQIIKRISCLKYLLYAGVLCSIIACILFSIFVFSNSLTLFKVLAPMSLLFFGCGLYAPVANAKAVTLHEGMSGPAASITGVAGMFTGFICSGAIAYMTFKPGISYAIIMIIIVIFVTLNSFFLIKFKPVSSDKKLRPDLQALQK